MESGLASVSVNSLTTPRCILSGPIDLCMFRFPSWESGDCLQWQGLCSTSSCLAVHPLKGCGKRGCQWRLRQRSCLIPQSCPQLFLPVCPSCSSQEIAFFDLSAPDDPPILKKGGEKEHLTASFQSYAISPANPARRIELHWARGMFCKAYGVSFTALLEQSKSSIRWPSGGPAVSTFLCNVPSSAVVENWEKSSNICAWLKEQKKVTVLAWRKEDGCWVRAQQSSLMFSKMDWVVN